MICSRSSCFNSTSTQLNLWALRKLKCVRGFFKGKAKGLLSVLKWNEIGISQHFRGQGLHVLAPNISLGWSSAEILAIWDVLHISDIWDVLHISALFPHCSDLQGNSHLDYDVVETENSYAKHLVRNILRSPTFILSFKTSAWSWLMHGLNMKF